MIKRTLFKSIIFGALVAGALTLFDARNRHAALVAQAARPVAGGRHTSVAVILLSGFVGATLAIGAVTFVLLLGAARRARRGQDRPERGPRGRRRYGYGPGGGW
jgi:hypothetical protein